MRQLSASGALAIVGLVAIALAATLLEQAQGRSRGGEVQVASNA